MKLIVNPASLRPYANRYEADSEALASFHRLKDLRVL